MDKSLEPFRSWYERRSPARGIEVPPHLEIGCDQLLQCLISDSNLYYDRMRCLAADEVLSYWLAHSDGDTSYSYFLSLFSILWECQILDTVDSASCQTTI
jgi:hypothetical protein